MKAMGNKQKTTFWDFINNYKIEIPIIQRDYAQGRKGKEALRKKFIDDLKKALDADDAQYPLILDFVYGSTKSGALNPLDGQQRLTTLWLLHWYIAYNSGKLDDKNVREILKKFTYETRVSSREFIEKLCDYKNPPKEGDNIAESIQNQTWFYSEWKQDPTIQSMLTILGGGGGDKDNLESVFGQLH